MTKKKMKLKHKGTEAAKAERERKKPRQQRDGCAMRGKQYRLDLMAFNSL